jgi:iron complex transport system substrate-binding protein
MRTKKTRAAKAPGRALAAFPAGILAALVLGGLAAALIFGSCVPREQKAATASDGGTGAERIISTAPSNTEIVIALGMAGKLVAVDTYSAGLEGLVGEPALIDFMYPDAEFILGLNPDLIIAAGHNQTGSGDNPFKLIQEAGVSVIYIPTSNSIAGIYEDIRLIAGTLGEEEKGNDIIRRMEAEVESIAALGASISPKKSVYIEISPFPFMVTCGEGTYLNEMVEIIGGENIFAGEKCWFSPGAEAILDHDPDVILTLMSPAEDGSQAPVEEILGRSGFETLRAVKNREVYALDTDSASRPSPGILLALRQMAHAVYPDRYAEGN